MGNLEGQQLGHYRVLAKIGEGGMGEVYRAHDEVLDRDVAIKVLPGEVADDRDRLSRFQREARAAAGLGHPNIVAVHELGAHDGRPFMVTELLEGHTVREAIDAGTLTNRQAIDMATQVAAGLAAAHSKGIVHRDLKPSNLFMTSDGTAKILDFGLARPLSSEGTADALAEAPTEELLTAVGSVVGTAGYMSPEQVRGLPADHRSDLFSFGVVLYEMLTGLSPFRRVTPADTASAVLTEDPPPVSETTSWVTPAFDGVVRRCLQKDPEDRYQSAEELRTALESVVAVPALAPPRRGGLLRTGSKALIVIPLLLAAALAFTLLHMGYRAVLDARVARSPAAVAPPRLVVLPFLNLGGPDEAFFADGMTEEITARLAKVNGLRVVSRTTAARYGDSTATVSEIGRELGVEYVLEGSVRWDPGSGPGRIRITPQLIRVADDSHLWAESFERTIDDVFRVQSEIAEQVAAQLGVTLLEEEREAVRRRPTENLEAYQAYLRGRWHRTRPHFTLDHWQEQLAAYERAVALDAGFALAHAAIAETHSELRYYGFDLSNRRVEMARAAADRAMDLAPKDPRVHLLLAYYFLWAERDADRALAELETARRGLGTTVDVIQTEIFVRSMKGRFGDAVRLADEAITMDPQNPSLPTQAIFDAWFLREYPRAIQYADRAFELAPESMWPLLGKTFVYWTWNGDTDSSRRALESLPRDFGAWTMWSWFWQEIFEGRLEEALHRVEVYGPDWVETKIVHRPRPFLRATVLQLMGRSGDAHREWEAALNMIETAAEEDPTNHLVRSSLGIARAALGDRDLAIAAGRHAKDLLPVSVDAFYGVTCEVDAARAFVLLGERDLALDQLDRLLTIPSWISVSWIEMDPTFEPLRDHPRYAEILADHRSN